MKGFDVIPAEYFKIGCGRGGQPILGHFVCYEKMQGFHHVGDGEPGKDFQRGRETIRLIF